MVESRRVGINRRVTGSSPVSGAILSMAHWVYILQNTRGKFYVGQTSDPAARLNSHNRTDKLSGKFTHATTVPGNLFGVKNTLR